MELTTLAVKNLFGHFNHIVHFNDEERITIITAPNGYGKSVILRILKAVFQGDFQYINKLYVKQVSVKFSTGIELRFVKLQENDSGMLIQKWDGDSCQESFNFDSLQIESKLLENPAVHHELNNLPWLERYGSDNWFDEDEEVIISTRDAVLKYASHSKALLKLTTEYPDWLSEFAESKDVRLIQDQRLILRSRMMVRRSTAAARRVQLDREANSIDTIEQYASELVNEIKRLAGEYSARAQNLDSTFPKRLLNPSAGINPLDVGTLRDKLSEIDKSRQLLGKYDLIKDNPEHYSIDQQIEDEDLKVLSLYVIDTRKKLQVYDELLIRIQLFTSILNSKRLNFKKVQVNNERGFFFLTDNQESLNLTDLSSGEQHEVVLLYELIFKTDSKSLVLIDEPEISLHVAWQRAFLDDLRNIKKLQLLTVVISTHSPQIIGNDSDLVVDLGGEGGN